MIYCLMSEPAALTLTGAAAPSGRADPAGRASQAQAHKDKPSDKVPSAKERASLTTCFW